jgi:hypothetical protein
MIKLKLVYSWCSNYGNLSAGKMMFAVNAYNQYWFSRTRKDSFEIQEVS